jgi:hypothetical protein
MPVAWMQSFCIEGHYAVVDVFRSVKHGGGLVLVCNHQGYLMQHTGIDLRKDLKVVHAGVCYSLDLVRIDAPRSEVVRSLYPNMNEFFHDLFLVVDFPADATEVELVAREMRQTFPLKPADDTFSTSKCLTTIQKGEKRWLESWIRWHQQLGFERFLVYDNGYEGDASYSTLFDLFPTELVVCPAAFPYWVDGQAVGQMIQQTHSIWRYCPEFLGLTDLDEYINPVACRLFEPSRAVLSIPNYWFGCNHGAAFTDTTLVQSLTRRTAVKETQWQRKCVLQPRHVDFVLVHWACNVDGDYYNASHDEVYLRHYRCTSYKNRLCDCSQYCAVDDPPTLSNP